MLTFTNDILNGIDNPKSIFHFGNMNYKAEQNEQYCGDYIECICLFNKFFI